VSGWSGPSTRSLIARARSKRGRAGGQLALGLEQEGQVVEALGGGGVVGPQHPLADLQGALEERPGGGQLALVLEQAGQVVEAAGGVGVVGPQHPLPDRQGALEERPGGGQLALGLEQVGLPPIRKVAIKPKANFMGSEKSIAPRPTSSPRRAVRCSAPRRRGGGG
jgi:hypothetical protein